MVEVVSKHGNVVIMSKDDYDAMAETAHLLRSPVNAERLLEAIERARRGEFEPARTARVVSRTLGFDPNGWEDYGYWQTQDRKRSNAPISSSSTYSATPSRASENRSR